MQSFFGSLRLSVGRTLRPTLRRTNGRRLAAALLCLSAPVLSAAFCVCMTRERLWAQPLSTVDTRLQELPFTQRRLANDRPTVSFDGKWIAYAVYTPPRSGKSDARWLPSGAPGIAVGRTVQITNVATGHTQVAGPSGSNCWRPAFAPNNRWLAFYCDAGAAVHLWMYDVDRRQARQLSGATIKAKLWIGDEPAWDPNSTEVYVPLVPPSDGVRGETPSRDSNPSLVTVQRAGAELPSAERPALPGQAQSLPSWVMTENNATLAAISFATGSARSLVPAGATPRPSLMKVAHSGRFLAYLSTSGREAAVVSLGGGAPLLSLSGLAASRSAAFSLTSWAWHPHRDQFYWVQDERLWTLDLTTQSAERRPVSTAPHSVTLGPLAFSRDGTRMIVGVRPLQLDDFHNAYAQALAIIPTDGDGSPRIVDLPAGLYVQDVILERGNTLWQPTPNDIEVVCENVATAQRSILRINLDSGPAQSLWEGLGDVRFAGASADGQVLIGSFEDTLTPANFYQFTSSGQRARQLTDVEPGFSRLAVGGVETFATTFAGIDGALVHTTTTVLLPPDVRKGDRRPTLVCQYPGLSLSHSAAANFAGGNACGVPLSLFTSHGYVVLLVDAPISPLDTPSNPALEMASVLVPQVNRAGELGYTDISRVAIIGGSAGGYSTAAVITCTRAFRAAIAVEGFYDLPGWSGPPTVIHQRMGGTPWANLQRYLINSPYYQASSIRTPLLLVHGESDLIPVDEARKLFNALRSLDRTVQLATYLGEGHVVYNWALPNAVDVSERMIGFLDKYVGQTSPAALP
jgi:dipeptidyl aminopeptidase/acylaminoacyl peptidase